MPELDAPAHSGNGYQWGEEEGLGKLAVCVNKGPWEKFCVEPPCGQMNLANPNLYDVVEVKNLLTQSWHCSIHFWGIDFNYGKDYAVH